MAHNRLSHRSWRRCLTRCAPLRHPILDERNATEFFFGRRGQNAAPTLSNRRPRSPNDRYAGSTAPDRVPSPWTSIGMDGEMRSTDFRTHRASMTRLDERNARHLDAQKDAGRLRRPASGEASNAGISGLRFRPVPRRRRRRAVRSIRRGRWRGPGRSSRRRKRLR